MCLQIVLLYTHIFVINRAYSGQTSLTVPHISLPQQIAPQGYVPPQMAAMYGMMPQQAMYMPMMQGTAYDVHHRQVSTYYMETCLNQTPLRLKKIHNTQVFELNKANVLSPKFILKN